MKRLLLSVWVISAAACGPRYGRRVPDDLVKKLPYEVRIELLEAENNLAVAIDKVDEASNEILRTREALRRAKGRRSEAKDEVGRASDPNSREVADLAVEEANLRVDYLRARQGVNQANEDVVALSLRCAFAEYEVARLAAARKAKVEGSERLLPEDFDNQLKRCKDEVAAQKQDMKEQEAAATAAKTDWEKTKTALAKKTFDARASPFVE